MEKDVWLSFMSNTWCAIEAISQIMEEHVIRLIVEQTISLMKKVTDAFQELGGILTVTIGNILLERVVGIALSTREVSIMTHGHAKL